MNVAAFKKTCTHTHTGRVHNFWLLLLLTRLWQNTLNSWDLESPYLTSSCYSDPIKTQSVAVKVTDILQPWKCFFVCFSIAFICSPYYIIGLNTSARPENTAVCVNILIPYNFQLFVSLKLCLVSGLSECAVSRLERLGFTWMCFSWICVLKSDNLQHSCTVT